MIRSNELEKSVKLGSVNLVGLIQLGHLSANLKVYCDYTPDTSNGFIDVFVLDCTKKHKKPKTVAHVLLERVRPIFGLPTYSVCIVGVDDKYKGFDLASKLYAYLLRSFRGWVLRSGSSQSIGGKYIWNSLCRERRVSVYAYSRRNDDIHQCYYDPSGEIDCDVDLYETKSDYYLYAVGA